MQKVLEALRPLLIKVFTRGLLWFFVTLLGLGAVNAEEPVTQVATGLGSLVIAAIAVLLDRWHHQKDLTEVPPNE